MVRRYLAGKELALRNKGREMRQERGWDLCADPVGYSFWNLLPEQQKGALT